MSNGVFGAAGYEASLNEVEDAFAVEPVDHMVIESGVVYGAEPIPRELAGPRRAPDGGARRDRATSAHRDDPASRTADAAIASMPSDSGAAHAPSRAQAEAYAQLRRVLQGAHRGNRHDRAGMPPGTTELDPPQIRHLVDMFRYSQGSERVDEFIEQAEYMADYEPEGTFDSSFHGFMPVYDDMTVGQLKGYFAWRTCVRRGEYAPISSSAAYVYVYELINGIGEATMTDAYLRLRAFREHYVARYDAGMARYVDRWLRDMVVAYELPEHIVRERFAERIAADDALGTLMRPQGRTVEQIARALHALGTYRSHRSPLNKTVPRPENGPTLYDRALAAAWLAIAQDRDPSEPGSFFRDYIAMRSTRPVSLFNAAVFSPRRAAARSPRTRRLVVDPTLTYMREHGRWYVDTYEAAPFQRTNVNDLLHEVDRVGRRIWRTGRDLKPRSAHPPCGDVIAQALAELHARIEREQWEAAHPPVHVDLTRLDSIRAAAADTRDSLLTEAELAAEREAERETANAEHRASESQTSRWLPDDDAQALPNHDDPERRTQAPDDVDDGDGAGEPIPPLTADELLLARALAAGAPAAEWKPKLLAKHVLPSVLAESINEKLFDRVDDIVLDTDENGDPALIDDYLPDVRHILAKIPE